MEAETRTVTMHPGSSVEFRLLNGRRIHCQPNLLGFPLHDLHHALVGQFGDIPSEMLPMALDLVTSGLSWFHHGDTDSIETFLGRDHPKQDILLSNCAHLTEMNADGRLGRVFGPTHGILLHTCPESLRYGQRPEYWVARALHGLLLLLMEPRRLETLARKDPKAAVAVVAFDRHRDRLLGADVLERVIPNWLTNGQAPGWLSAYVSAANAAVCNLDDMQGAHLDREALKASAEQAAQLVAHLTANAKRMPPYNDSAPAAFGVRSLGPYPAIAQLYFGDLIGRRTYAKAVRTAEAQSFDLLQGELPLGAS
jgi:hypothetical protein